MAKRTMARSGVLLHQFDGIAVGILDLRYPHTRS
jgi:hypothetical protein